MLLRFFIACGDEEHAKFLIFPNKTAIMDILEKSRHLYVEITEREVGADE